jgi:hypothetical protein
MGDGGIAAVFKGLAADAVTAGRNIAHSVSAIAEKTADIEESNLRNLLDSDSRVADSFKNLDRGSAQGTPSSECRGPTSTRMPSSGSRR